MGGFHCAGKEAAATTPKQQRFVDAYVGNATQAAIEAGYSRKSARITGAKLLTNPNIQAAIQERERHESRRRIASRQQRQEFWTSILQDEGASIFARIKASELLGKSEGDFIDRQQIDMTITPASIIEEVRRRRDG